MAAAGHPAFLARDAVDEHGEEAGEEGGNHANENEKERAVHGCRLGGSAGFGKRELPRGNSAGPASGGGAILVPVA